MAVKVPQDVAEFLEAGERRERITRTRRRRLVALAFGLLAAITTVSVVAARAFYEKEQLARRQAIEISLAGADIGLFDLAIAPFDWDPTRLEWTAVDHSELPDLDWRLFQADRSNPEHPKNPIDPSMIKRTRATATMAVEKALIDRVEVRSGQAFLEITGRGRRGERCGPSWIRLQALPGFADRKSPPARIRLPVPTCRATSAGMIEVPAGDFIKDGTGVPMTNHPEYVQPESRIWLPSFRMDRTEVSNAQYRLFFELESMTGYYRDPYPEVGALPRLGMPDSPLTGVDVFTGEAFCRFLGKRLPSSEEWEKAARGGLVLDADGRVENPSSRRNLPWGTGEIIGRANLAGAADGYEGVAPVESFIEGKSPYGFVNMAGNVYEWTSSSSAKGLRIIRGGSWTSREEDEEYMIAYENSRPPRFFSYEIGIRCAVDAL